MSNNFYSQHIIVMGVSGCGKTTMASMLAEELSWPYYDGDDFHSIKNITKLKAGIALDDLDRQDWLLALQALLIKLSSRGISSVLACSALKAQYRAVLQHSFLKEPTQVALGFLWLDIPFADAKKRVRTRTHEFMSPKLLQSQFDTLEPPNAETEHITLYRVDASGPNTQENIARVYTECLQTIRR